MIRQRCGFLLLWVTLALSLGISGCVVPTPTAAHVRDVSDVEVFYQPLAPFGSWIVLEGYGQVWIPHHLRADWRPYTDGRWVYTEDGWMWIAEEEWGWATFHYGRWGYTTHYGWFWVPDVVWAPAWVSWQHTPGWVGWAPLPPTAVFRADIGFGSVYVDIAPSHFCFVEERWMLAPRVVRYIAPPTRNAALLNISRNVTHYTVINNRVVNRGIAVERIERATRQAVPRLRVVAPRDDRPERRTYVREREREVVVGRPSVRWNAPPGGERPGRPPTSSPRSPERDKTPTPPYERRRPGLSEPAPGAVAPPPPPGSRQQPERIERPPRREQGMPGQVTPREPPPAPESRQQPYRMERPPRREQSRPEQGTPQEPQRRELRQPPGGIPRQEGHERQQPQQQRQSIPPPQVEERRQGMSPPPSREPYGQQPPQPPQDVPGRGQGQPPQRGAPPSLPPEIGGRPPLP